MLVHQDLSFSQTQQLVSHNGIPGESDATPLSSEEQETNTIARLASQHHTSEYSCTKFGPNGCPVPYVPLSAQAPEIFQELQNRQMQSSHTKSWWLSDTLASKASPGIPVILGPSGVSRAAPEMLSNGLVQELSAAMAEQMPSNSDSDRILQSPSPIYPPQSHPIKTSSSHPINISSIIPTDALPVISSHVLFRDLQNSSEVAPSPTIFELPSPFTLDRFILSHPKQYSHSRHQQATTPLRNISPLAVPPLPVATPSAHLRTRTHVTEALHAAINSGIKPASSFHRDPLATFHSNTSSLSLSVSVQVTTTTNEMISRSISEHSSYPHIKVRPDNYSDEGVNKPGRPIHAEGLNVGHPSSFQTGLVFSNELPRLSPPFTLGNLYLSSCPGKKVRLQGPVKGRSGVCRDLFTDMQRMKDLGVGCVVCCLDDTELEFLGAPWSEYQDVVHRIGIDVLRLPTPEGLPPSSSPAALDKQLTSLIQNYTLKAIPILVHCRGGVGRAGVIACCWILKLGLCGWFEDAPSASVTSTSTSLSSSTLSCTDSSPESSLTPTTPAGTRFDTFRLVEKVIAVVRRRRSIKAVETYEQVKFLIDFVEYLRNRSGGAT